MGQVSQGAAQLSNMFQALRLGQIPPLPGQQPGQPPFGGRQSGIPGGPLDATAMLGMILRNPQLHQALQLATVLGPAAPRTLDLAVPTAAASGGMGQLRNVQMPLGAVMNAIRSLVGEAMEELNANTHEEDPEVPGYLVSEEGDFIVDPASADDRAALVTYLFRLDGQARRSGLIDPPPQLMDVELLDESEAWAREAGFDIGRTE
jgi:hypothetical protein